MEIVDSYTILTGVARQRGIDSPPIPRERGSVRTRTAADGALRSSLRRQKGARCEPTRL